MDKWLERLKAFKFLEYEITSLVLLLLTVVCVFTGAIAQAGLLASLFFTALLFRELPRNRMKSWKAFGVEVHLYEEVKEQVQVINTGAIDARADLQHLAERIKLWSYNRTNR
jgi:hypothetical protein